jgi:hypothetical protein
MSDLMTDRGHDDDMVKIVLPYHMYENIMWVFSEFINFNDLGDEKAHRIYEALMSAEWVDGFVGVD